eukprot:jgi/Tetstr1/433921/TSEL_023098.t1
MATLQTHLLLTCPDFFIAGERNPLIRIGDRSQMLMNLSGPDDPRCQVPNSLEESLRVVLLDTEDGLHLYRELQHVFNEIIQKAHTFLQLCESMMPATQSLVFVPSGADFSQRRRGALASPP